MLVPRYLTVAVFSVVGFAAAALAVTRPGLSVSKATEASNLNAGAVDQAQARIFLNSAASEDASRLGLLPAGTQSVLNLPVRLSYGSWVWNDAGVPPGTLTIYVDLRRQLLSAFRGKHEIGTAVILYGTDTFGTPLGRFHVMAKMKNHRSSNYDAAMPFTLRLTDDGVSIHGSDVRGSHATHGCVGVPMGFAARLFSQSSVGTSVRIVMSKPPTAVAKDVRASTAS